MAGATRAVVGFWETGMNEKRARDADGSGGGSAAAGLGARVAPVLPGSLLVLFGGAVVAATIRLDIGTAARMGPGAMPVFVGALIVLVGLVCLAVDLVALGRAAAPAPPVPWRGLVLITLAIAFFALTIHLSGMFLAAFVLLYMSSMAAVSPRPVEAAVFSALLSLAVVGIFAWGLGLFIPVLPTLPG